LSQSGGCERDRGFTGEAGDKIELDRHVNQRLIKFDLAEPGDRQTQETSIDRRNLRFQTRFRGPEGGAKRKQRFSAMAKPRFMAGAQSLFHQLLGSFPEINGRYGNILVSSNFERHLVNNRDIAPVTVQNDYFFKALP